MTPFEQAGILLIGQGVIVLALLRVVRTFGIYTERLVKTHDQNVILRYNIAAQQSEDAIRYLVDHPQEREA